MCAIARCVRVCTTWIMDAEMGMCDKLYGSNGMAHALGVSTLVVRFLYTSSDGYMIVRMLSVCVCVYMCAE